MTTEVKYRRGTTAQHATFTGAEGEVTVDTDREALVVHDNATAGGFPVPSRVELQNQSMVYIAAGGTVDVITLTVVPAITAYVTGQRFAFKASGPNTTAVTINVNSKGAKTAKKDGGSRDLDAGDFITGQIVEVAYDGTNMQVESPLASHGGDTFIEEIIAANDATIEFTTGIDSEHDEYEIQIINLVPATDDTELYLRYQVAAAWKSGATDYSYNMQFNNTPGVSAGAAQILLASAGGEDGVGSGAGESWSGRIHIYNPASTVRWSNMNVMANYNNTTSPFSVLGAGVYDAGVEAVTGFQFLMSAGNITSGTFRLFGKKR